MEFIDAKSKLRTDLGKFITIGTLRVRLGSIMSYEYRPRLNQDKNKIEHFVYVSTTSTGANCFYSEFETQGDAQKAVETIDWIFKKEYEKE